MIFIDGSHATHVDSKGFSVLFATMGNGTTMNVSKKLGLVITSSTETEVASTRESFPKCTRFRCFGMAQGDVVKEDTLFQDKRSSTFLHKNYQFSIGKGVRHINVRYFFVVDKVEKKELNSLPFVTRSLYAFLGLLRLGVIPLW